MHHGSHERLAGEHVLARDVSDVDGAGLAGEGKRHRHVSDGHAIVVFEVVARCIMHDVRRGDANGGDLALHLDLRYVERFHPQVSTCLRIVRLREGLA